MLTSKVLLYSQPARFCSCALYAVDIASCSLVWKEKGAKRRGWRTLLIMSSWLARWALHDLQPYILLLLR